MADRRNDWLVDAGGAPLTFFHGTESQFSVFDMTLAGSQQGKVKALWFTTSRENAGFYGPEIMEVHLAMKNPLVVDAADPETVFFRKSPSHIARFAKSMGHDGLIIRDTVDGSHPGDTCVVFHADQVKVAEMALRPSPMPTPFDRWFAQSKVVDAAGAPRVVYHGTTVDIDAFHDNKATEKDAGWYGRGIYFTADPTTASAYSGYEEMQGKPLSGAPRVMPVFVSLQNPYVWPADRAAALTPAHANEIRKELEAAGHDGVIVPNSHADEAFATHYEVVAFRPQQIKSAIGNSGAFCIDDPEITDRRAASAKAALAWLQNPSENRSIRP